MEETIKPQEEVQPVESVATPLDPMVRIITKEALVDIKVSSGYYKRFQLLVDLIGKNKTPEELESAKQQIKDQKITEEWVYHMETVLIFCRDFEQLATANGFTKELPLSEALKEVELEPTPNDNQ